MRHFSVLLLIVGLFVTVLGYRIHSHIEIVTGWVFIGIAILYAILSPKDKEE